MVYAENSYRVRRSSPIRNQLACSAGVDKTPAFLCYTHPDFQLRARKDHVWAFPTEQIPPKKGLPRGQTSNMTTYSELRKAGLVANIHCGLLPQG